MHQLLTCYCVHVTCTSNRQQTVRHKYHNNDKILISVLQLESQAIVDIQIHCRIF